MEIAAIILLVLCYAAAGYLAWQQRSPIYLLGLLAGHLSALISPLWRLLYGVGSGVSLDSVRAALSQPAPLSLLLAAGWHYPLPALVVLYLYMTRWWFPGPLTGLLTFTIFLLYHMLIELIGLRANLWAYRSLELPLNLPAPLLAAIMAALISYAMLYVLLSTYRYAGLSMALAVLPSALMLSLLVHGLLGAPLWITLALNGEGWAVAIGAISALALLAWGVQIVTGGLRRVE